MATRGAQTYLTPEEYITLERKAIPDVETSQKRIYEWQRLFLCLEF